VRPFLTVFGRLFLDVGPTPRRGALLDRESVREVFRAHVVPMLKQAMFLNTDGLGTAVAETMAP